MFPTPITRALVATFFVAQLAACHDDGGGTLPAATSPPAAATTAVVSVKVSGVAAGNRLTLTDNGGDAVAVTADGTASFPTPVTIGRPYRIALSSVPAGQACSVLFGAGTTTAAGAVGAQVVCGPAPSSSGFVPSGTLVGARFQGRLAALQDGSALFIGGYPFGPFPTTFPVTFSVDRGIDRYDPASGTWSRVGALETDGLVDFVQQLPSGKVLLLIRSSSTERAFLFDPSTSRMSGGTAAKTMQSADGAVMLLDGRVLAISLGGFVCEIYDPATDTWTATGSPTFYYESELALTGDGRVLIAGGNAGDAELYDPASGHWTTQAPLPHSTTAAHLVSLPDGRVLVVGGRIDVSCCTPGATIRLPVPQTAVFDPSTGHWTSTARIVIGGFSTATLLASGRVLAAGGTDFSYSTASGPEALPQTFADATIFDPATNTWTPFAPLPKPRAGHAAVRLTGGKVLLAGGYLVVANAPPPPGAIGANYHSEDDLTSLLVW